MRTWLLAIAVLVSFPAFAEERVLIEATVGHGGLICDTPQEVEQFLSLTKLGTSAQDALNSIEGCGILLRPTLMRVVSVKALHDCHVVRYDFLSESVPSQYGLAPKKGQDI